MNFLSSLPRWAQNIIKRYESEIKEKNEEIKKLQLAHTVLNGRLWFTIPGPPPDAVYPNDLYYLWFLDKGGAHMACCLKHGDVLLVGRQEKKD